MSIEQQLHDSNASRVRAWKALQGVRTALDEAGVEVPPILKPKCFENEGVTLRLALLKALIDLHEHIRALNTAIGGVRPFISNSQNEAGYPHALLALNRAAGQPEGSEEICKRIHAAMRSLR